VFTLTVVFGMKRRHPDLQYCTRCATQVLRQDDYELVGGTKTTPGLDEDENHVTGSDISNQDGETAIERKPLPQEHA
jgi:hypothetical protein